MFEPVDAPFSLVPDTRIAGDLGHANPEGIGAFAAGMSAASIARGTFSDHVRKWLEDREESSSALGPRVMSDLLETARIVDEHEGLAPVMARAQFIFPGDAWDMVPAMITDGEDLTEARGARSPARSRASRRRRSRPSRPTPSTRRTPRPRPSSSRTRTRTAIPRRRAPATSGTRRGPATHARRRCPARLTARRRGRRATPVRSARPARRCTEQHHRHPVPVAWYSTRHGPSSHLFIPRCRTRRHSLDELRQRRRCSLRCASGSAAGGDLRLEPGPRDRAQIVRQPEREPRRYVCVGGGGAALEDGGCGLDLREPRRLHPRLLSLPERHPSHPRLVVQSRPLRRGRGRRLHDARDTVPELHELTHPPAEPGGFGA